MNYKILEVNNDKLLKQFIDFPYVLYKNSQFWVPPLYLQEQEFYNPAKNAFFEHSDVKLFLCCKNGEIAGRISANINHNYNDFHREKIGFWGSFETINDSETVKTMFGAVSEFFSKNNIKTIRGPFTFSTNEICGMLVNKFDVPPMIMMPYNFDYYEKLLLDSGHFKTKDLFAYFLDYETYKKINAVDIDKFKTKYQIESRYIDYKNFENEIKILSSIYNDAWEKNWGFVPMTYKEFYNMGKELKTFVPKESVVIAYSEGEPAGFLISLPDFNFALKRTNGKLLPFGIFKILYYKRKITQGRVITLGLSKKFRRRGIDLFLIQEAIKLNGDKYYKNGCELSWILEDNKVMNKILLNFGLEPYKIYRVFEKNI
ncbi:MAG TPA: hypothetical protein PKY81_07605 [bacterium]|nr:hypothetical protein [bacterium]